MGIRDSFKRPHENLQVWQGATDLVETIYRISADFPDSERFGLTSQLRRAAISIPSNIAEGAARRSTPEYLRFLSMARGSLSELDTQLQIAQRLTYLSDAQNATELATRIFAKLNALIRSIQTNEERLMQRRTPLLPIPNPESQISC